MLPNADSFNDLSPEDKALLLKYIETNFKQIESINRKHSAYFLKARFNRLTGPDKGHHITSRCFMEAMVKSGYKASPVRGAREPNWYFNIGTVHFTD